MRRALKGEKLVNRRDRGGIAAADAHFPAPRPVSRFVADRGAAGAHDRGAGDHLRVHRERLGEVAGTERRLDVAHMRAYPGDVGGVGGVGAVEDDSTAVRQVFEDVRRGVLVYAHDVFATSLHRGEVVRALRSSAGSEKTDY